MSNVDPQLELFKQLVHANKYDFCKLVYIIFPYGQPGHPLEHKKPHDWQMQEWKKMSDWFSNPETRDKTYKKPYQQVTDRAKLLGHRRLFS